MSRRGVGVNTMMRKLRLATGLVLFVFLTLHLTNMIFGLASLDLLLAAQPVLSAPWANPVGSVVLLASFAVHLALGFVALYRRNTLRMPAYDAVQYVAAFLIFPLLLAHLFGVKLAFSMIGFVPGYLSVLHTFWVQLPEEGLRQVVLVAVAWIHGAVGVFTWLRLYPWWRRVAPFAYPLAVAVPVAALLGFVEAGNQVIALGPNPPPGSFVAAPDGAPPFAERYAFYLRVEWLTLGAYFVVLALVMAARSWRLDRFGDRTVELRYRHGPTIQTPAGPTLLEMSRLNDVPHANMCRGRGRCGTCRVRIGFASASLPPPSELEQKTLDRVEAPRGVRLACQVAPAAGIVELERLLPADTGMTGARDEDAAGEAVPEALP